MEPSGIMFCPRCGTKNINARFCVNCGCQMPQMNPGNQINQMNLGNQMNNPYSFGNPTGQQQSAVRKSNIRWDRLLQ